VLNRTSFGNLSNFRNAPTLLIPYRVSEPQKQVQQRPEHPAKNVMSGNYNGDGRDSSKSVRGLLGLGRNNRRQGRDNSLGYGGFSGNDYGSNGFENDIFGSTDNNFGVFGDGSYRGGYNSRGQYGGFKK